MSNSDCVIAGKSGAPVARLNLLLCFFGKTKAQPWCDAGLNALSAWSALVPGEATAWLSLGASSSKMIAGGPTALSKCIRQLEAGRSRDSSINVVTVQGPQKYGADFAFNWTYLAAAADPETSESNLLEMRFGHNYLAQIGEQNFVQWAVRLAEAIPFDSGYGGLSWSACQESSELEAGRSLGALALRHPGFDVSNNRSTQFEIGIQCRGPQWLTFIGEQLIRRTASTAELRAAVAEGQVCDLGARVMVQAGTKPIIGDTNRQHARPPWIELAKRLEPGTFFGDYTLDILFNDEEELRERWERRFLSP